MKMKYEDMNKDNSKKFTCKQCDKICKTEHSAYRAY